VQEAADGAIPVAREDDGGIGDVALVHAPAKHVQPGAERVALDGERPHTDTVCASASP
jgi:hypothetical protein